MTTSHNCIQDTPATLGAPGGPVVLNMNFNVADLNPAQGLGANISRQMSEIMNIGDVQLGANLLTVTHVVGASIVVETFVVFYESA